MASTIGLASASAAGQGKALWSYGAALSGNGQKIAFVSASTNLIANDTYGFDDVYITDRPTGSIPPDPHDVYFISPSGAGNVGGIAFTGADILRYTRSSNSWQMVYDGSDHGTVKNISAFDVMTHSDGSWLLVFSANQVIPGLGTATPRDVVHWNPNHPQRLPLGARRLRVVLARHRWADNDGKRDALHVTWDGHVYISTTGGVAVGPGNVIKAQDEDVLDCVRDNGVCTWQQTLFLDGSTIPGMKAEDVSGFGYGPATNRYYLTITGAFCAAGGVAGSSKSIVLRLSPSG